MLEILLFATAFIGSLIAGLFDLKTTEIPDEIPYVMMVIGIIGNLIISYITWSYWPFLLSVVVGLVFLGFGFIMYYLGQWGGGDAKVLSAVGFLVPKLPVDFNVSLFFPFPLSFFFNLFLVGAAYMIVYAIVLSIINRKIWFVFLKDIRANAKMIAVFNILLILLMFLFGLVYTNFFSFINSIDLVMFYIILVLSCTGLFFLWKFVRVVEDVGFKKKIPVSKLRIGDVPLDYKVWEGITDKDLLKIKKSGKRYIWIKEGVRFAPAFPLALLFTLFYGDGVMFLMNFFV